ncbi:cytosolic phospholipase A2 zeta [Diretmus argenteus]
MASKSDCYVILRLPTASTKNHRTKSMTNSQRPVWNETFNFRVYSHIKNILEIQLYDEDPLMRDDLMSTTLFDISNLTPGKKETKVFTINHEGAPFSSVDVNVAHLRSNEQTKDMVVKLRGAFQDDSMQSKDGKTVRFFVNKDLDTELGLAVSSMMTDATAVNAALVSSIPLGEKQQLDVRLEFDIGPAEKEFLEKRKVVAQKALQKLLGLSSPPDPQKVPTIAIVGSGGGTRAMTGLLGSLKGLQDLGVLDTVSYITGVSGSTWAMSILYQEADWSQKSLDIPITATEKSITKEFMEVFEADKLQYYNTELERKGERGYDVSLIDMWGLVIEDMIFGKENPRTLSEQRKAMTEGQSPLPIYTAVNMKDGPKGHAPEAEWCEFTPYEVGIAKYGAYVKAEDFGSQFFLGHLIKRLPENRLAFLIEVDSETQETNVDTYTFNPITESANMVTSFLKDRPVIAELYNYMQGFFLHWNYNNHSNFNAWKDAHPDAFPNKLTPTDPTLKLVDAGHAINIGCAPIVRPERKVDVVLSLSYSWDPDIFNVLKKTVAYCKDHDLPFPKIDFDKLALESKKEMYVFEDKDNPKAPIVVHFALVNDTYKQFKAPGVHRHTKEEKIAGNLDVSSIESPYKTRNLTYTSDVFRSLVDITHYNICNNKEGLLKVLRRAMERKA